MEDKTLSLSDYLAILNRRKWQFILPAVVIFIVALGISVSLPTLYRSSATILIEQQEIPMDLVRSTITTYADQRIQVINQRVMTSENLGRILERYDLYSSLRLKRGIASAIDRMRKDISIEMIRSGPGTTSIAFSIAYETESPRLAQQVTDDLASLFLDENARERKRATREISGFLDQESNRLAEEVSSIEAKLAKFKEQHGDVIPEMMQVNSQLLERAADSLRQTDQEIRSLEISQIYLQSELAKLNPYVSVASGSGERSITPAERLRTLETEILRLRSRYSETHPDRIAIEREIEALRREIGGRETETATETDADHIRRLLAQQRRELSDLRSRRSSEHPDVKALERQIAVTEQRLESGGADTDAGETATVADATNPLYVQMGAQIAANRAKLDALRQNRDAVELRRTELEARVAEGPKIEREYRLLTRDYDSAVSKYNQIRSKHMEAVLAESLEAESKGERFVLIEPPSLPEQPSGPSVAKKILLGFILALGGGVGTIAALELLDDRIYSIRAIQSLSGAVPLAVIPLIETPADQRRRHFKYIGLALGSVSIVILFVIALELFVLPLEVLWPKIVEKLGSIASPATW